MEVKTRTRRRYTPEPKQENQESFEQEIVEILSNQCLRKIGTNFKRNGVHVRYRKISQVFMAPETIRYAVAEVETESVLERRGGGSPRTDYQYWLVDLKLERAEWLAANFSDYDDTVVDRVALQFREDNALSDVIFVVADATTAPEARTLSDHQFRLHSVNITQL